MYPDVVVITGTSRGFGKQLAVELLKEGIAVIGISRSPTEIIASHFEWIQQDISMLSQTENKIADRINSILFPNVKLGVILSAGTLGIFGGLLDSDLYNWSRIYQTNVLGNLAVLKGTLPRMIDSRYGRIIFLAGGGSAYGYPLFSGYSLSKTAIVREVENLSIELENNILIKGNFSTVALAPGAMKTDMLDHVKSVGGEVKTIVEISEPIEFCKQFLQSDNSYRLDGRFVHVRDVWKKYLDDDTPIEDYKWLLRRTE